MSLVRLRLSPAPPSASIDSGRTIPGWLLLASLAVAAVAAFLAAAAGLLSAGVVAVVAVVIAATVAVTVQRPGYLAFALSLIPVVIVGLTVAPVGYTWRTPLVMVAVHASLRLSWFTSQGSATTRVELAVLAAEGRRFAVVDLLGQGAALLAGALTVLSRSGGGGSASGTASGTAWIGLAGAIALLAGAAVLRGAARGGR